MTPKSIGVQDNEYLKQTLKQTFRTFRYLPCELTQINDFGLAVANTLAAYNAGAKFASVTVTGSGSVLEMHQWNR